jgi:exopolysaccharide production protein ExoF
MLFHLRVTSRFGLAGLLLFCLALALASQPAAADDYRLGPLDKLKIRVVEWQTIEGTFREWTAVSGDYVVGASGNLSLPFLGETAATGKTTAEIAAAISGSLQQKFGLSDRPEASVELLEYRPFYISGDVQNPGQYPYVPGLTVMKAMTIAGGLRRNAGQRAERDFLNARGNYDVSADERLRLQVKRARLTAEVEGKADFDLPPEVAAAPQAATVKAEEIAIMSARQEKLKRQLEALDSLKQLLESEVASLQQKAKTQTRQVDLARQELESIGTLADKGLVVNARILSAERTIADLEGKLLDLDTAVLAARQDISKADQDAIALQKTLESDIAVERQQVEAELAEAGVKLDMYRGLIAEALTVAPDSALASEDVEMTLRLVRTVDGKTAETDVDENTPVQPDDVIEVRLKLPPLSQSAVQ